MSIKIPKKALFIPSKHAAGRKKASKKVKKFTYGGRKRKTI